MTELTKAEQHAKSREYFKKLRDKAYEILGGKCSSCGEPDYIVLCIDHIQPIRRLRRQAISLYCEIINDPETSIKKFMLLCRNCNWRKMIENNEGQPYEAQFAYASDFENLLERVQHLEVKLAVHRKTEKPGAIIETKRQWTEQQIEKIIEPNISRLKNEEGRLDVAAMRLLLREKGIEITQWKAYGVKRNLELLFPKLFEH